MERRLAAILAADVVGYTRLMSEDEAGTFLRLTKLREQALEPLIAKHRGRVVKLLGDGLLVEFASVVDALDCALAWQSQVAEHEAELELDKRMRFRIGINLGDVIVQNGDIYGEGVNIAARLEGIADPGSIFVSVDAYRQVRGKIDVEFESLGEVEVKNLKEPVNIFRVVQKSPIPAVTNPQQFHDKPSIAVLPFTNMSGDSEQEYFSDGITEDIITELSRFPGLLIIARNSSFYFKNQSIDVREAGKQLGAEYVVEGSVRKSGNRIRITAQLIEARSGKHIWAQRYDRKLVDVFELQDEVTRVIAGTIPGRLEAAEAQLSSRKAPEDMNAYDQFLRGLQEFNRSHVIIPREARKAHVNARRYFEYAIDLDASYARAHAYLALTKFSEFFYRYAQKDTLHQALETAHMAMMLDQDDKFAPAIHGLILISLGRESEGVADLEQALEFNKNNAELLHWAGLIISFIGQSEEGVSLINEAIQLDPFNKGYYNALGFSYYLQGQFEDAVEAFRNIVRAEWTYSQAALAASYSKLGRKEEARFHADQVARNLAREFRERGEPVPESICMHCDQVWQDYLPRAGWADSMLDELRKIGLS